MLRVLRLKKAVEVWRYLKLPFNWLPTGSSSTTSSPTSPDAKPIPTINFDQELGVAILRRALTTRARAILANAGEEASVIVGTLLKQYGTADKFAWGYDAAKGEYVDMIKAGIVDPFKVVRTALVEASGVASLLCARRG